MEGEGRQISTMVQAPPTYPKCIRSPSRGLMLDRNKITGNVLELAVDRQKGGALQGEKDTAEKEKGDSPSDVQCYL